MSVQIRRGYGDLVRRGEDALRRAETWLKSMRWDGPSTEYCGMFRSSAWHDPERWPDMLVPGTYNATIARVLIGGVSSLTAAERDAIGGYLARYQAPDGRFQLPMMDDSSVYKHDDIRRTWEYIALHLTNYARQALAWTRPDLVVAPTFVGEIVADADVSQWLATRNWDNPWMEGNVIVNVGGLLLDIGKEATVDEIIAQLNGMQDPTTGFWGTDQAGSRRSLIQAFAGAMHSFHLYYYRDVPIPHADRAVDVGLDLSERELAGVTSACLDVDLVEMLASLWPANYKRIEIRDAIASKVAALISVQNDDGGFFDERAGIRRFDGWVGGYWEPQGLSNCFATWFRSLTVAIGLSVLEPRTTERWTFRDRVGIGYFDPRRLKET